MPFLHALCCDPTEFSLASRSFGISSGAKRAASLRRPFHMPCSAVRSDSFSIPLLRETLGGRKKSHPCGAHSARRAVCSKDLVLDLIRRRPAWYDAVTLNYEFESGAEIRAGVALLRDENVYASVKTGKVPPRSTAKRDCLRPNHGSLSTIRRKPAGRPRRLAQFLHRPFAIRNNIFAVHRWSGEVTRFKL